MHINDAVFLEDLCPKFRIRQWRKSIHKFTGKSCIYCGKPSESIDHVLPRSQGGLSTTESYTCLNAKESSLVNFKFYQKLIVVLISLSTILIFPESPKDLENICESYNSSKLCKVW